MKKVFLGGICNENKWRDKIIKLLDISPLSYFDPVVKKWDKQAQNRELVERRICEFCLYAITPKMTGVHDIAEVIDDSNKRPEKTILILLEADEGLEFSRGQWKSVQAVANMVTLNGGKVFYSLDEAVIWMESTLSMSSTKKTGFFETIQNAVDDFIHAVK